MTPRANHSEDWWKRQAAFLFPGQAVNTDQCLGPVTAAPDATVRSIKDLVPAVTWEEEQALALVTEGLVCKPCWQKASAQGGAFMDQWERYGNLLHGACDL